jgi:hypothetical protein
MQQAVKFQFSRAVQEYADWRAVEDNRRSPGASWWWSSALAVMDEQDSMPPAWCRALELPAGSSLRGGRATLHGRCCGTKILAGRVSANAGAAGTGR